MFSWIDPAGTTWRAVKDFVLAFFKWIKKILVWLDQGLNVIFAPILNRFIGESPHRFGDPDETLSSVFGKNVEAGYCKLCTFMCRWLDWLDTDHCKKAIERDEGRRAL